MAIENELWYSPSAKAHKLCKFSTDNVEQAIQFSIDTVCAVKNDIGKYEFYHLLKFDYGLDWCPLFDSYDPLIPDELKALCLILL